MQKIIFIIVACLLAGCTQTPKHPPQKPLLLVSIAPYRFFAEQIAGDEFDVQSIVPPDVNPHSYEPTGHQVAQMGNAAMWLRIGEPFEPKILPILRQHTPDLVVCDLREGIDLIEETHCMGCKGCSMDHLDRHVWLSPKLAIKQAQLIEKTLSHRFPEKSPLFQKNLQLLSLQLSALDQEIRALLEPVVKRQILVSHPAFGYFCQEYRFEQISIEYEGKDPRPQHLEAVLRQAVAQSLEVALALPQYNNKGAQLIAKKLHVPVRLIDPYSAEYFAMMRQLAHVLAEP